MLPLIGLVSILVGACAAGSADALLSTESNPDSDGSANDSCNSDQDNDCGDDD